MARIKIMDGGDRAKVLDYLFPIVGRQAVTGATCAVSVPTIAAGDVVLAQIENPGTATNYTLYSVITAGTGFVTTFNADPKSGTLAYAVFHVNG